MRLFAEWLPGQDSSTEHPYLVRWANGQEATLADYAEYYACHQTLIPAFKTGKGDILVLYTEELADVRFDHQRLKWIYAAPGGEELELDLSNPDASDDEINEAIMQFIFLPDSTFERRAAEKRRAAGG